MRLKKKTILVYDSFVFGYKLFKALYINNFSLLIYLAYSQEIIIFKSLSKKQIIYADMFFGAQYLSLPPTRHDLTQGQKPEGRLKWG